MVVKHPAPILGLPRKSQSVGLAVGGLPGRSDSRGGFVAGQRQLLPDQVSGLRCWVRADDLRYGEGRSITGSWPDRSGNRNDLAILSSANPPAMRRCVPELGGSPAALLVGNLEHFVAPAAMVSGVTQAEAMIVYRPAAIGVQMGMWRLAGDAEVSFQPYLDNNVYDLFGSTARKDNIFSITHTRARIYGALSAPSRWEAWLNGVRRFSTGTNTVTFSSTSTLWVGQSRNSVRTTASYLAEFMFFSRPLDGPERAGIVAYLKNRYAITP